MSETVLAISQPRLALAFLPVAATLAIFLAWSLHLRHPLYALLRMLVQLLLVGYVLAYSFGADAWGLILLVLLFMASAAEARRHRFGPGVRVILPQRAKQRKNAWSIFGRGSRRTAAADAPPGHCSQEQRSSALPSRCGQNQCSPRTQRRSVLPR
ncbi:ABC transporter permease [Pseudohaliea rubra]|uniref:YbbM seven transmembrane helix protein n=1 Tax=Pseudohaliea rubra DSM 19751 TaxID=1265313 RepID=A0A095XXE7_9GAMM|nr:ABC transporter permease [Pseudohaliea rubra]KGE04396.1 YbbM seven transmembrane helix protein [Pseudohaliea rubra DSM 19751]